MSEKIKRTTIP